MLKNWPQFDHGRAAPWTTAIMGIASRMNCAAARDGMYMKNEPPEFKIQGTRLGAFDGSGGAIVELDTTHGTYGPCVRAFNQGDVRVARALEDPEIPASVVSHVAKLNAAKIAQLRDNPALHARNVNGTTFGPAIRLNPKALRILAAVPSRATSWQPAWDPQWVAAGIASHAQLVGLPSRPAENIGTLLARLQNSERLMSTINEPRRKAVAPTLPLEHPQFQSMFQRLVDAGAPVILLEYRDMVTAVANLPFVHALLGRTTRPPYVVGINVPRHWGAFQASSALASFRWGVQASAIAVSNGFPPGPVDLGAVEWFSRPQGGYYANAELPANWDRGCSCPPHQEGRTDPTIADPPELFDKRRLHDAWAHLQDRPTILDHVAAGTFESGYVAIRPSLRKALAGE